eukprot:s129_g32.t5
MGRVVACCQDQLDDQQRGYEEARQRLARAGEVEAALRQELSNVRSELEDLEVREAKSNEMAADIEEEMNQLADRACIKGCERSQEDNERLGREEEASVLAVPLKCGGKSDPNLLPNRKEVTVPQVQPWQNCLKRFHCSAVRDAMSAKLS